jgi:hypothetical protein
MTRPEHWYPAGDLACIRGKLMDALVFLMKSEDRIAAAEIEQHLADMRGEIARRRLVKVNGCGAAEDCFMTSETMCSKRLF